MRVYFRERLRNRLYDLIIGEVAAFKAKGMTQAQLARRIDKRQDQLCRLLSGPGNMTLDTVSDLLLGLSGAELAMTLDVVDKQPARSVSAPHWLATVVDNLVSSNPPPSAARSIASSAHLIVVDITSSHTVAATASLAMTQEMEYA